MLMANSSIAMKKDQSLNPGCAQPTSVKNTGSGRCSVFGDSSWKLFNEARAHGYLELIIACLECGLLAIVENIT